MLTALGRHMLKLQTILPEWFRILIVSGFALVADAGSLFLLTKYAHIHYLISAVCAFMIGLAVNYLLSVAWGYTNRKIANRRREFLIFAVIGVLGAGWNELIIWGLTEKLGLYFMLSKGISAALVFIWNYGVRKFLIF